MIAPCRPPRLLNGELPLRRGHAALLAAFYDRVGARPAKGPCHVHSTALCVSSHMEQSQATTIMHKNQI